MPEIHEPGDEPIVGADRLIVHAYSSHAGFIQTDPDSPAVPVVLLDLDAYADGHDVPVKLIFEDRGARAVIEAMQNSLSMIDHSLGKDS